MRVTLFEGKDHVVYKDRPYDYLVVETKGDKTFDVVKDGRLVCNRYGCFVQAEGKTVKLS